MFNTYVFILAYSFSNPILNIKYFNDINNILLSLYISPYINYHLKLHFVPKEFQKFVNQA